jgi:hypothetical protein
MIQSKLMANPYQPQKPSHGVFITYHGDLFTLMSDILSNTKATTFNYLFSVILHSTAMVSLDANKGVYERRKGYVCVMHPDDRKSQKQLARFDFVTFS